jgi:ribonuclease HII
MLKSRYTEDTKIECGIDEAGRGSLWGPLYAGAVVWPDESTWTPEIRASSEKIKDSKKLSEKKRNILLLILLQDLTLSRSM